MGKKAWIVFVLVCIVIIATALVLMLVLVPQVKTTTVQAGTYEAIAKQEYTFSGNTLATLKKEYNVTKSDVDKGKQTNKYEEGNINPFTPPNQVTIYNEPTLPKDPDKDTGKGGSQVLTPEDK